jgi:hypothetical protein
MKNVQIAGTVIANAKTKNVQIVGIVIANAERSKI